VTGARAAVTGAEPPSDANGILSVITDGIRYGSGMSVLAPLVGGALIGAAAAIAFALDGRIAGVSGALGRLIFSGGDGRGFRAAFLLGLAVVGVLAAFAAPAAFGHGTPRLPIIAVAGVLVGWGTRVGNGCTSGHGVCGIGRMSPRSMIAVGVFMLTGGITVAIVRALGVAS
jgi:hypothetical protein